MRGLIRWDLVRRDALRAGIISVLVAVGVVVLVNAMNRVDSVARGVVDDHWAGRFKAGDPFYDAEQRTNATLDVLDLPHPARTLDMTCVFSKTGSGYQVHVDETLTLASDDPIVQPIRTGDFDTSAASRLFSGPTVGADWHDQNRSLVGPVVHFVQTGAAIHIVAEQTADASLANHDQVLFIEPARDVDTFRVTVDTGDLTIDGIRGLTPLSQDAHSVRAAFGSSGGTLAIEFSPTAADFRARSKVAPASFASAVVSYVPSILLVTMSASTLLQLRRLRRVLIPIAVGVVWVFSGPPTPRFGTTIRYHDIESSLLLFVLPVALYLALRTVQGADVLAGRFAAFPAAVAAMGTVLALAALSERSPQRSPTRPDRSPSTSATGSSSRSPWRCSGFPPRSPSPASSPRKAPGRRSSPR